MGRPYIVGLVIAYLSLRWSLVGPYGAMLAMLVYLGSLCRLMADSDSPILCPSVWRLCLISYVPQAEALISG